MPVLQAGVLPIGVHPIEKTRTMKTHCIRPASLIQAAGLFILLLTLSLFLGCGTTNGERKPFLTLTPASLESKAEAVTLIAATEVLQNNPKLRDEFERGNRDLKVIAENPGFGLTDLMEIADRFPTDQLKGDNAFYIKAGILFFKDEIGEVAVNQPEQVQFAARGMSRALDAVLAQTPAN